MLIVLRDDRKIVPFFIVIYIMESILTLKIILENPTAGVDYGLQEGKDSDFNTIQTKRGNGKDLKFECSVRVKFNEGKNPVYLGPFAQGPSNDRFIYIDIGTCAGQIDSCWSRRLKIPLSGITMEMVQQVLSDPKQLIETIVPGSGKGGGPNCGTVKPFNGWKLKQNK